MLIIRLIRFFLGYVRFSATGGFPERFVNLCTNRRIPLWNMKKVGNVLYGETTVEGYKAIRQSAYRSGVKMELVGKCGLPFFLSGNRRRKGIVIGFLASMLIVFLLSTMVWSISVEGNKNLTEAEVIEAFEQLGVRRGVFSKKIRASEVAEEAEKLLPGLLWASVNIKGSRVEIVVCERTDAPEFPDKTPCNIVASEDGVITAIQANIGLEAVKAGDAVVKGDLLISGITRNLDMSESFKAARGNVTAEVKREICADCADLIFYTQSEKKTRYSLYFFGLKIPLDFRVGEENYHKSESMLSNGKITLPAGIITEHSFCNENEAKIPPEKQRLMNANLFCESYYEIYCEAEIKQAVFTEQNAAFMCEITAEKDIGLRQEIYIEN